MSEESENDLASNSSHEDDRRPSRKLMHAPLLSLQILGLWEPEGYKKSLKGVFYSIYSVFVTTMVVILMTSAAINLKYTTSDIREFTDSLLIAIVSAHFVAKVYQLLRRRESILRVMDTLDELVVVWGLVARAQPSLAERRAAIQLWQRHVSRVTIFVLVNTIFAWFMWNIFPVLPSKEKDRGLPFGGWFPFDKRWGQSGYWVAYTIQFVASFCDAWGSMSSNCFYMSLVAYAVLTVRSLQPAFRDIRAADPSEERARIREAIRRHQTVLRLVEEISNIIGPLMFIQSIGVSLLLCSTVVHLTVINIMSLKFLSVLIFATLQMSELFVYCWLGSQVQSESMKCGMELYNSEWWEAKPSSKRSLRFVMMRAQKPAMIRGFGYTSVSLELFTSLMRLSYSFYALLRRMDA